MHYIEIKLECVYRRQIQLVEAFPPEQITELAEYRPLLLVLHGILQVSVVGSRRYDRTHCQNLPWTHLLRT